MFHTVQYSLKDDGSRGQATGRRGGSAGRWESIRDDGANKPVKPRDDGRSIRNAPTVIPAKAGIQAYETAGFRTKYGMTGGVYGMTGGVYGMTGGVYGMTGGVYGTTGE